MDGHISDLVTFSEEIFNGKLHFLCSDSKKKIHDWLSPPRMLTHLQAAVSISLYLFISFITLFNVGKLK